MNQRKQIKKSVQKICWIMCEMEKHFRRAKQSNNNNNANLRGKKNPVVIKTFVYLILRLFSLSSAHQIFLRLFFSTFCSLLKINLFTVLKLSEARLIFVRKIMKIRWSSPHWTFFFFSLQQQQAKIVYSNLSRCFSLIFAI